MNTIFLVTLCKRGRIMASKVTKSKKPCKREGETRSKSGKCRALKPCPDGRTRSRTTGHCRKPCVCYEFKQCPEGYTRNRDTNRCRKVETAKKAYKKNSKSKNGKSKKGKSKGKGKKKATKSKTKKTKVKVESRTPSRRSSLMDMSPSIFY